MEEIKAIKSIKKDDINDIELNNDTVDKEKLTVVINDILKRLDIIERSLAI